MRSLSLIAHQTRDAEDVAALHADVAVAIEVHAESLLGEVDHGLDHAFLPFASCADADLRADYQNVIHRYLVKVNG